MNNRPHDPIPPIASWLLRSHALAAAAIVLLLAFAAGAWAGWKLRGQEMPAPEIVAAAPAVRQEDGSLVAGRSPTPKPPPAPHALPKGAKEERRISATVSPAKPDCPPVRLDLSLFQDDAGGRRVAASSPDGEVIQALDMPIAAALVPPPAKPWAVGVSWAPREELGGVWLERDLGRWRLGADLEEEMGGGLRAQLRLGWKFNL